MSDVKVPEVTEVENAPEVTEIENAPEVTDAPKVVDTKVAKVNSEVPVALMPIMAKQDVTANVKQKAKEVKALEDSIISKGAQLGTLYAARKITEATAVNSEIAKLTKQLDKLGNDSDGIDVKLLETVKKRSESYVPSVTGLGNAIESLQAKLTEQKELREVEMESDDITPERKQELETDIFIINSKLGKRNARNTSSTRVSKYVQEDGSAAWTAADSDRSVTAKQLSEMKKIYTDATARSEKQPLSFVMKYLIEIDVVKKGKNSEGATDTNSNWTPVAKLVGHGSD